MKSRFVKGLAYDRRIILWKSLCNTPRNMIKFDTGNADGSGEGEGGTAMKKQYGVRSVFSVFLFVLSLFCMLAGCHGPQYKDEEKEEENDPSKKITINEEALQQATTLLNGLG